MKKILLSISLMIFGVAAHGQVADTLSTFFTGTPTVYGVSPTQGGGYVSGNNGYGDLGKGMRFNSTTGLIGSGTINKVLLWVPFKKITNATSTFSVKVHTYVNDSTLGTVLGSATMQLSQIDTSIASYSTAHGRPYNVKVPFTSPIAIPANKDVVVMVYLPTTAGDTIALISNQDGNFAAALTNTFEIWDNGKLHNVLEWNLDVAWGIYPVVSFTASLDENALTASVHPNPADNELNIQLNAPASSVSIIAMSGKIIMTQAASSNLINLNVSDLLPGVYFYEIVGENGAIYRNTFIKK